MAHEIENEMIAYSGEMPWHGIGAKLEESDDADTFLRAAKLDWEVVASPLFCEVGDSRIRIPNKSAFVRSTDKKVMTVASDDWKPLQNRDALNFMQRYVSAGGATMEVAGGLRDGAVVWGLARLNHEFEIRPGDRVKGYLLITSPHVAGNAIKIQTTTVRVVCANTMALANTTRHSEVNYKQNHLTEFDVEAAREAIGNAHEQLAAAERRSRTLDQLKITMEDAVVKALIPVFAPEIETDSEVIKNIMAPANMPKKIAAILDSVQNAPGAITDTAWGVMNGVTHYFDHVAGRNSATRLASSFLGDAVNKKLEVEKRLMELAA